MELIDRIIADPVCVIEGSYEELVDVQERLELTIQECTDRDDNTQYANQMRRAYEAVTHALS